MDARLQRAIQTPRIQTQAGELVTLAQRALDDLRQLDDSLYERFVATRDAPADTRAAAESLHKLWDTTFGGLRQLLWCCRSIVDLQGATDVPGAEVDPVVSDDELDFGEHAEPKAKVDDLALGSADLLDFLEQIDEQEHEDDAKRWKKVIERVASIEYGLTSQQNEANERLKVALSTGEIGHALGVLDDTQSSASEGVHALVTAIYDAFVPDVNPTTVVPGYLTALGRALLVRRGVAELATNLAPFNDQLQAGDPSTHEAALSAVRATLHAYVGSVVCRAMRPADRWQMVEFERQLQSEPVAVARLTSEGLVKYLDSLGSINQREVLVMHDRRTIEVMRDAVSNARQLLDLSPRAAVEMMDRAYQAAQRLKGRSPVTDKLVAELEMHSPHSANPGEGIAFLEGLEGVLSAAGG
ncbi:MAG TPA: hypothetical protein VFQ65_18630 [Kofleriaceae bacterium]|nr:hypothetical protein [Kofleriaceae bacterium]